MIPKNNGGYVSIADAYNVLTDYYHHKTDVQHAALLEALLKVPPADVRPAWRSTETDPPKIGEPVLIARKIRHNETVLVEPAVLRPDGTWKAIGHKIKPSSVRHWMPMPEPPEGGADG